MRKTQRQPTQEEIAEAHKNIARVLADWYFLLSPKRTEQICEDIIRVGNMFNQEILTLQGKEKKEDR